MQKLYGSPDNMPSAEQADIKTMEKPVNSRLNGVAPLPHLGVIRVSGEDAVTFLQSQLTQDFMLLDMNEARLAGFCNAKGRMQASFIGLKTSQEEIVLVVSRDILAATLKRLFMFVLRAKVKLSDATADLALYGLAGNAMTHYAPGVLTPWNKVQAGRAHLVCLYPADGEPRGLWLAPADEPKPDGSPIDHGLWLWTEVRSAVATITVPIVEAFVPQMLNYESVGGVNFKKGCYPGQEVVARSQFRGTLKRRAYLAHATAPLHAGQEIFHEADPAQPCGLVAQAAMFQDSWSAIVSIQVAAAQGGRLAIGQADGPPLQLEPLPYLLLADV
jgi:folate-binding protein YgfZ